MLEPEELVISEGPLTEREAAELAALIHSMHAVRVAIVADVVGADAIDARDLVRDLAVGVGQQILGPDNTVGVDEPEILAGDAIRVAVLVGSTHLEPGEAVATFAAATGRTGWAQPVVRDHDKGQHVSMQWCALGRPERGISRLEIHAAPGIALVPDDELP